MPADRPGVPTLPHRSIVSRLVDELRALPFVIAVGAYGSTATAQWTVHSDVDLLAVLDVDPPVESLRFFVDGIAVDLNLRSDDASERGIRGADFVPHASPLWDPGNVLSRARPTGRAHNSNATDVGRYMLFHDTQKLRQIEDATLRRIAMGAVVDQIVRAWYQARGEVFPGMVVSGSDLRARDPVMVDLLNEALTSFSGLDGLLEAGQRAATPAGGVFGPGQTLAVSWMRPAVGPVPPELESFVRRVTTV